MANLPTSACTAPKYASNSSCASDRRNQRMLLRQGALGRSPETAVSPRLTTAVISRVTDCYACACMPCLAVLVTGVSTFALSFSTMPAKGGAFFGFAIVVAAALITWGIIALVDVANDDSSSDDGASTRGTGSSELQVCVFSLSSLSLYLYLSLSLVYPLVFTSPQSSVCVACLVGKESCNRPMDHQQRKSVFGSCCTGPTLSRYSPRQGRKGKGKGQDRTRQDRTAWDGTDGLHGWREGLRRFEALGGVLNL